MDLSRPSALIRRWIPLAVIGVAIVAAPTYVLASRQTPVYEVSVTLLPEQLLPASDPDYNSTSVARLVGLATTWSVIAETPAVLDAAAQTLGQSPNAVVMARMVDVAVDANTAALTITARATDPDRAVALANAVGAAVAEQSSPTPSNPTSLVEDLDRLRTQIRDTEVEYQDLLLSAGPRTPAMEEQLASMVALLAELRATYDSLAASMLTVPDGLIIVNGAQVDEVRQTAPRTIYYTSLAVATALLLTLALAAMLMYLDDRVRDAATVRRITGLVTLGSVGKRRRWLLRRELPLPTLTKPKSRQAEAYRSLRAAMVLESTSSPITTLLVVGTGDAAGSARTAANLAVACAQAGDRVLLVDADLRRPRLHRLFKVANDRGLSTLMTDSTMPVLRVSTSIEGLERLRLLPAGEVPLDPAQLLGSVTFRSRLDRFALDHDIVILNAPPLDGAVDGAVIADIAARTMLVVNSEKNHEKDLLGAADQLLRADASVIGAVLYRASKPTYTRYGNPGAAAGASAQGAPDTRPNPAPGSVDPH